MLNIITCFEVGIEDQCIALYRSIDRYFSSSTGLRVLGISPRIDQLPSLAASTEAKKLGVECIEANLNSEFAFYALANKPLSCLHVAELFPNESYLFLDSDTLFLRPTSLDFAIGSGVMVRPVDAANIGVNSFDDPNGAYWKALYEIVGATTPRQLLSSRDDQLIYEYYNSGFVFCETDQLFKRWNSLFSSVMRTATRPNDGLFFVEQSTLSAAISSRALSAKPLPHDMNYPIHMHFSLPDRSRVVDVRDLKHIHYHKLFADKSTRSDLISQLGFDESSKDLIEMLDW